MKLIQTWGRSPICQTGTLMPSPLTLLKKWTNPMWCRTVSYGIACVFWVHDLPFMRCMTVSYGVAYVFWVHDLPFMRCMTVSYDAACAPEWAFDRSQSCAEEDAQVRCAACARTEIAIYYRQRIARSWDSTFRMLRGTAFDSKVSRRFLPGIKPFLIYVFILFSALCT